MEFTPTGYLTVNVVPCVVALIPLIWIASLVVLICYKVEVVYVVLLSTGYESPNCRPELNLVVISDPDVSHTLST